MSSDIIIITGKINSGKTTACKTWINRQKKDGKSVGGILSIPVWRKGEKNAYYAYDISTEESILLATTAAVSPASSYGRFRFPRTGLDFAETVLRNACGLSGGKPKETIIVDEIGPLELKEKGFASVLRELLNEYSGTLILVTRESHTEALCRHFHIECTPEMYIRPNEEIPA